MEMILELYMVRLYDSSEEKEGFDPEVARLVRALKCYWYRFYRLGRSGGGRGWRQTILWCILYRDTYKYQGNHNLVPSNYRHRNIRKKELVEPRHSWRHSGKDSVNKLKWKQGKKSSLYKDMKKNQWLIISVYLELIMCIILLTRNLNCTESLRTIFWVETNGRNLIAIINSLT